jgi:uncharacterized protein (TIGR00661 family)
MKILYGIQGTGNGHLSRAEDIVPALQKIAEVDVLVSGNQSQVPSVFTIDYQRKGLTFFTSKNGGINFGKSLVNFNLGNFISEIRDFPAKKYDLIISDFEPISAWSATIKNVPCIELSHQAAVYHPASPKYEKSDFLGSYVLQHYCPAKTKYGFHFQSYDKTIFEPIIRKSVRECTPSDQNYYLVYLPAYHDDSIFNILSCFDVNWKVFSKYAKEIKIKNNVEFHPIDNANFLRSFENCTGVLCGAGFELPAEALYLGKKLMVIPMKGQFEQQCNAASLKELGIGVLPELSLIHHRSIQNWITITKPLHIQYSTNLDNIIEKLLLDFEQNAIPKIELKRPLFNLEFYKLFL